MHVNSKGCTPYSIDIPRAGFLKNANARDIHTACGLYTLASNCKGALCAYVTHCRFWSSALWDASCGYGDPTPYRGVPIIDVSRVVAPLSRDEFYLSNPAIVGEGKKARVCVPLGFKMAFRPPGGEAAEDDEDESITSGNATLYPASAEVAILPRRVQVAGGGGNDEDLLFTTSSDMRLSPHGAIPLEIAHIMTIFVETDAKERHNILNLDYNGARDVGSAPAASTGKRHTWSSAIPSAIDDDDDEDTSDQADAKRLKASMDSVS